MEINIEGNAFAFSWVSSGNQDAMGTNVETVAQIGSLQYQAKSERMNEYVCYTLKRFS